MSKATKQVSKSIVWFVLLLVLVGLGGYGARNFGGSVRTMGSVGSTEISVTRYQRALRATLQAASAQIGKQLTFQDAVAFGLDQQAVTNVVAQTALEDEAARIGLSVGDAEVQKQLKAMNEFKGFDGNFDLKLYREALKQNNETVSSFETALRSSAAREVLQTAVLTGVSMPASFAETMFTYVGERRSFAWASLDAAGLAAPLATPTEADLKTFYEAHPADFTLPETRKITYVWITPSMLAPSMPVDEAELHKLYDQKADTYNTPEKRLVERLSFGTEAEAQAAWDRLQKGEITFAALVEERKLKLDDIDLGDVTRADLGGAAGDAVFAMTGPGLVGPVASDLGPAIFRMNGVLPASTTTFDEARPELVDEYSTEAARRKIGDMVEQVNDLLASGATFEEVAKETGMELGHIDYFDGQTEGIAGYTSFRDAASQVADGDFPSVADLDDGGIFALTLDKIVPPTLQPQADVAAKVTEGWTKAATITALQAQADGLLARFEAGEDPAALGLTLTQETAMKRADFVDGLPAEVLLKAFELEKGKSARVDAATGDARVYLVRLDDVLPPDPADKDLAAQKATYAGQLSQGLGRDLLDAFTNGIEATAGIKIDQNVLNAVNTQFR
jgi:peptidyl-prolyl cis-trans isomerase D